MHRSITIEKLARIGDKITISFDKSPDSTYSWGGYRDIAHLDGKQGTIVERSTYVDYITRVGLDVGKGLNPGAYEAPGMFIAEFEGGERHKVDMHCAVLTENHEQVMSQRQEERRGIDWKVEEYGNYKFLRDLPELPFWEGDVVQPLTSAQLKTELGETFTIRQIHYRDLDRPAPEDWDEEVGGKWQPRIFEIRSSIGYSISVRQDDLALVERGNAYKFYHNEPLVFRDLEEEIGFAMWMQQTDQIECPQTGHYGWEGPENFLPGIRDGIIDGIRVGGLFGSRSVSGYKFHDRDLGRRVAAKTLEGFKA